MRGPLSSAWLVITLACACGTTHAATVTTPVATAEARADSLFRAGRYDAARAGYEAALDALERARAPDSNAVATLWLELADTHGRLAHFAQAVTLGERALAYRDRRPIADSVALATALNNLALNVDERNDAPRARTLLERALEIERRALGDDHPYTLSTTHNLAIVMEHLADYRPAGELAERSATVWARQLIPELQSPAAALGLLSRLQSGEAERLIVERARVIWEMGRGPGRVQVLPALTAGGAVTHAGGSYFWWAQLVRHLRPFGERIAGPDHPDMIYVLTMLADMQEGSGEFAESKRTLERALELAERSFGPVHPTVSMVSGTLGWLAYESGDYPQAKSRFERAIDIDERIYGPSGAEGWFNDLGLVLEELGDEPRAEALYTRALSGETAEPGPPHLYQAHLLNNLGRIELRRGHLATARLELERSLAIMETMPFPDHPRIAPVLVNLATIDATEGRLDSARVRLERALDVTQRMNGPQHPDVAWALLQLARVDAKAGLRDSALTQALRAEAIAREHQRVTIRGVSEREALRYAAARPPALDFAASLAATAERHDPARTRALWDALIRGRALVLDEMAARHRAAIATSDSGVGVAVERVTAARERLANLVVRGLRATPAGPSAAPPLDAARRELDRAEAELAERSASFRSELALRRAGFAEMAAALDSGSALVAYLRYESNGGGYVALVAGHGSEQPALVPLGRADVVDSLAAHWGAAVRSIERRPPWNRSRGDGAAEPGERLRRAVWDPLAPHLAGARRVFVVPDGALMLVPFGALSRGGRYLIEDPVVLHELSAERDLVSLHDAAPPNRGLLAMGGPDFDATDLLASQGGAAPASEGSAFRSRGSSCDALRRRRFETLPQAAAEARWIASLWNETAAPADSAGGEPESARALTGALATETRFKREAPGKRVLHIATHGFFVGDACRGEASRAAGAAVWLEPDSPLLLSGLALAGANHRARDDAERDDGILTAEEVGSLDLSGVDWAVLSACESGAGRVRPGEGVLGLRRAFEVAGVRTLIMSLWPVSDEWAKVWMSSLYRARLESGAGTAEAVRRASLEVLERRRREGLSTEPYYWAGFVATGDWR